MTIKETTCEKSFNLEPYKAALKKLLKKRIFSAGKQEKTFLALIIAKVCFTDYKNFYVKNENKKHITLGLCDIIRSLLKIAHGIKGAKEFEVVNYIPEFVKQTAYDLDKTGKTKDVNTFLFWWKKDPYDFESREEFLDHIIRIQTKRAYNEMEYRFDMFYYYTIILFTLTGVIFTIPLREPIFFILWSVCFISTLLVMISKKYIKKLENKQSKN